jgi:hypothetical protein
MTSTLTPREKELARSALHFEGKKAQIDFVYPHYNSDEFDIWWGMEERGLAVSWCRPADDECAEFCLTHAGALAALEAGETLCEDDFPR